MNNRRFNKCADQLMGWWMVEDGRFARALKTCSSVDLIKLRDSNAKNEDSMKSMVDKMSTYENIDGVAVVSMNGIMTKEPHSFMALVGGSSTMLATRALQKAKADGFDKAVLHLSSPGGSAVGPPAMADAMSKMQADGSFKIWSFIEDIGASAAYYVASQSERILTTKSSEVGGIGTYAVLYDQSEQFEREGIEAIVIKEGEFKGILEPGVEITDKTKAEVQRRIASMNDLFVDAVASGRGISKDQARKLADGRVHMGNQAAELGLVDGIAATLEEVVEQMNAQPTERRFNMNLSELTVDQIQDQRPDLVKQIEDGAREGLVKEADAKESGAQEERERFARLQDEFGDRPAFVIEQFQKGNDSTSASLAYAALCKSERDEATTRLKEAEKRTARQSDDEADGIKAVNVSPSGGQEEDSNSDRPDPDDDPKACAEWEWDNDHEGVKSRGRFSSKQNYVNVRAAELSGKFRVTQRS